MRITGPGIWGLPRDESKAIALVRRVVDRRVTFVDTADSYGRGIRETLIAKALLSLSGRAGCGDKGRAYATRCQPLGRQLSARAFAPRLCGQLEKPGARARRALPATCRRSPDTDRGFGRCARKSPARRADPSYPSLERLGEGACPSTRRRQNRLRPYNLRDRSSDGLIDICAGSLGIF
jgi:pyridoxine 4-dehydrogenase